MARVAPNSMRASESLAACCYIQIQAVRLPVAVPVGPARSHTSDPESQQAAVAAGLQLAMASGGEGEAGDDYTKDGSVDLRGNPVLRSKRGGWTACSFIIGTSCAILLHHRFIGLAAGRRSRSPAGSPAAVMLRRDLL